MTEGLLTGSSWPEVARGGDDHSALRRRNFNLASAKFDFSELRSREEPREKRGQPRLLELSLKLVLRTAARGYTVWRKWDLRINRRTRDFNVTVIL